MVAFAFEITYTGTARISQTRWRKTKRAVYGGVANHWFAHMRPKHFTHAGAREYGYVRRSGEQGTGKRFWSSYTGRKKKEKGHTRPLEWSGNMKREVSRRRIVPKHDGAQVRMHARVFNLRRIGKDRRIDPRIEMTTVSAAEQRILLKLAKEITLRQLPKRNRRNMSVTIGVL